MFFPRHSSQHSFLEAAIDSKSVAPPNPEKFGLWLEWAHWYADAICPITPTRPRESSVENPENLPIQDVEFTRQTGAVIELLPCENTDELFEMERNDVRSYCDDKIWWVWREINLVLEGLGYDLSDRDTRYC